MNTHSIARPKRVFSLQALETVEYQYDKQPEYFVLSYKWRYSIKGEKGWLVHDKQRDKKWHVMSTKFDMILYLKEAFMSTLLKNHMDKGIWMDSLCVCQEDEDEKSTEIPISRYYFANAEMCLLCPWIGFGVSREDHKQSGDIWANRSWPVQEIVISKTVGLLYNSAINGIKWKFKQINTPDDVSNDIEKVYGDKFVGELKKMIFYKQNKKEALSIEESLRLSYKRQFLHVSDLIYAFVGMSNIDQKFGKREDNIISTLEWLYHSLPKKDRIKMLSITAKPIEVAEGASWMPNYTKDGLMYDCNVVMNTPIAEVDKYEYGIGITIINTVIVTIITNCTENDTSKELARYYTFKCTKPFIEDEQVLYSMWCEELNKPVKGYIWGDVMHGKYKFIIIGKTLIYNKPYYVAAVCFQPHSNIKSYRKIGLACIKYKKILVDYINSHYETCIIG